LVLGPDIVEVPEGIDQALAQVTLEPPRFDMLTSLPIEGAGFAGCQIPEASLDWYEAVDLKEDDQITNLWKKTSMINYIF